MQPVKIDEFGYQSYHLVVSFNDSRASLSEYSRFVGLKAEIQVRSILQHAWASMSHKIDYKYSNEAPSNLRRKLYLLSALTELLDDEFSSLQDMSIQTREEIKKNIDQGIQDIELNIDSLRIFIESSKTIKRIEGIAKNIGFSFESLEHYNGYLFSALTELKFITINDISTLFEKNISEEESILKEFHSMLIETGNNYISFQGIFAALLLRYKQEEITHNKNLICLLKETPYYDSDLKNIFLKWANIKA